MEPTLYLREQAQGDKIICPNHSKLNSNPTSVPRSQHTLNHNPILPPWNRENNESEVRHDFVSWGSL